MKEIELTADWVNEIFNNLIENNEISYRQLNPFNRMLEDFFKEIIFKKEKINASEFIVACLSSFILYDLKQQKCSPAILLSERRKGVQYPRPLNYLDIEEAKKRFNTLFKELILKLSSHCNIQKNETAFFWFELIRDLQNIDKFDLYIPRYQWGYTVSDTVPAITTEQQTNMGSVYLVPSKFIEYILYGHYNLNPNIAKEGLGYVNLCNADEAAKKFNISKTNLIKKCLESTFGAYLRTNCEKYKIKSFGAQYSQKYIDEIADPDYQYPYLGFIRLSKQSNCQNYLSLEAFYVGDGICWQYVSNRAQNPEDPFLIPVQPALSEIIQGNHKSLILQRGQKITIDDLFFIEDELDTQPIKKKSINKKHDLHFLIEEYFTEQDQSCNKITEKIWNELKELANDFHPIIQEVDPWEYGRDNAYIYWKKLNSALEDKMQRKTFENIISDLKKMSRVPLEL